MNEIVRGLMERQLRTMNERIEYMVEDLAVSKERTACIESDLNTLCASRDALLEALEQ